MNDQITTQEAEDLNEEYINTRSSVIDTDLGYTDSRTFNFSLDKLKDYIEIIEEYGANHSQVDLGITIFMGAYSTAPNGEPKATVFLAPTYNDGDDLNKDVDPLNYAKPGVNDY